MQQKSKENPEQVLYLNRWVDKCSFRTFVYSKTEQKLAESYDDYQNLLMSGLWYATKEDAEKLPKVTKRKVLKEAAKNKENDVNNEVKLEEKDGKMVQLNDFKSNKTSSSAGL